MSSYKDRSYESSNVISVPAVSLSDVISHQDSGRIRIIKIDVDGADLMPRTRLLGHK